MNEKYKYWWFDNLSFKFIDDLLQYGKQHNLQDAHIGLDETKISKEELFKKRKSKTTFFNEFWINRQLSGFMKEANRNSGWNYQLNELEPSQFTYYDSNKSFYGWHQDSHEEVYQNQKIESLNGKIRKISCIIPLSNKEDFEGGELEFCWIVDGEYKTKVCTEIYKKGTIIFFPSYLYHRVTPVTKGERYSLVAWAVGDKFK